MIEIRREIEQIQALKGGQTISPHDVVEFAKDPDTELHKRFVWDDTKAGKLYRLEQARGIIRAVITVLPANDGKPIQVRAYVSLPSERGPNGGYRTVVSVLNDQNSYDEMREMLRQDLLRLQIKYRAYSELANFVEEIAASVPKRAGLHDRPAA